MNEEIQSIPDADPAIPPVSAVSGDCPETHDFRTFMSDEVGELFGALSLAQGQIEGASKNQKSVTPQFTNEFADLDAVWSTIREPLSSNGLCVVQSMMKRPDGTLLVTMLGHKSGQWIRSEAPIKPDGRLDKKTNKIVVGIHQIASAITYMRRYALMAVVGVSPKDDDGNKAAGL